MPPEARSRKARFYVLRTSAFPYATHRATLLKSFLEGKHFVLEKSWEQHPSATMGIHPHSGDARLQQTAVIPYCHQQTHSLKKGEERESYHHTSWTLGSGHTLSGMAALWKGHTEKKSTHAVWWQSIGFTDGKVAFSHTDSIHLLRAVLTNDNSSSLATLESLHLNIYGYLYSWKARGSASLPLP